MRNNKKKLCHTVLIIFPRDLWNAVNEDKVSQVYYSNVQPHEI